MKMPSNNKSGGGCGGQWSSANGSRFLTELRVSWKQTLRPNYQLHFEMMNS